VRHAGHLPRVSVMRMNTMLSLSLPSPPGRRLGGTYESALERMCVDCQEKKKSTFWDSVHKELKTSASILL